MAHLAQDLVGLVRAVHVDSGSDGRAGAEPEKHSHRATEHADQHADEAASRGAATDHVVFALLETDRSFGSPLDDHRAADADPAVAVCLPQRAQCLILLAALFEGDRYDVVTVAHVNHSLFVACCLVTW